MPIGFSKGLSIFILFLFDRIRQSFIKTFPCTGYEYTKLFWIKSSFTTEAFAWELSINNWQIQGHESAMEKGGRKKPNEPQTVSMNLGNRSPVQAAKIGQL